MNLQILFGSRTLIHGPSGIGKTTLLHLIAGLLLPDEGSVVIGTHKFQQLTDSLRCTFRRKTLGIVLERLNLINFAGERVAI